MANNVRVKIESLNEEGYGIGFDQGREYWVINSIPGEEIIVEVIGKKKKARLARPIEFIEKSKLRKEPFDFGYLSNSPWQIFEYSLEIETKKNFIKDWFRENNIDWNWDNLQIYTDNKIHGYRNKAEFSFYLSENEINLGLYRKDSKRGKMPVKSTILLPDIVNQFLAKLVNFLNQNIDNPKCLKGVLARYSFSENKIVLVLFIKDKIFDIKMDKFNEFFDKNNFLKGLLVCYSDHRSPAFRLDKEILKIGSTDIREKLLDKEFIYPFDGFFQVNPNVFEEVLRDVRIIINENIDRDSIIYDIYSGIGTIGISVSDLSKEVNCIEIFDKSHEYCERNCKKNNISNIKFIQKAAENAINDFKFNKNAFIIVDPPRAGLHKKVIDALNSSGCKNILYLSCNPKSQAQDISKLSDQYEIKFMKGYNFYPNTPHVENLVWLTLSDKKRKEILSNNTL